MILKKLPEPHETQELTNKNCMLCSVLVNIDQQNEKKVIHNFCYVSENIIFSNLNLTGGRG